MQIVILCKGFSTVNFAHFKAVYFRSPFSFIKSLKDRIFSDSNAVWRTVFIEQPLRPPRSDWKYNVSSDILFRVLIKTKMESLQMKR